MLEILSLSHPRTAISLVQIQPVQVPPTCSTLNSFLRFFTQVGWKSSGPFDVNSYRLVTVPRREPSLYYPRVEPCLSPLLYDDSVHVLHIVPKRYGPSVQGWALSIFLWTEGGAKKGG